MHNNIYLGFDFGYKRIGVAVGQKLTGTASPLAVLKATQGVPKWHEIDKLMTQWQPQGLVVGLPTCIDDSKLYTTKAARRFAASLHAHCSIPIYLVDERLSTVEARDYLFHQGGYRALQNTAVDSIAACVILEQWLHTQ